MQLLPIPCPYCGKNLDYHRGVTGDHEIPKAGDISVCWYCRKPARYVAWLGSLRLEKLTEEEIAELLRDPRMWVVLDSMRGPLAPDASVQLWRRRAKEAPGDNP